MGQASSTASDSPVVMYRYKIKIYKEIEVLTNEKMHQEQMRELFDKIGRMAYAGLSVEKLDYIGVEAHEAHPIDI